MEKKFPFPINPEDAGDNFAVGFLSPVAGPEPLPLLA